MSALSELRAARSTLSDELARHARAIREIKAMRALGAPSAECQTLYVDERAKHGLTRRVLRGVLRRALAVEYPPHPTQKPKLPSAPKAPTLGLLKRQFPKLRTEHFARVRALKSKLVEGRITLEEYVHKEQALKDTWEAEVRHTAGS